MPLKKPSYLWEMKLKKKMDLKSAADAPKRTGQTQNEKLQQSP